MELSRFLLFQALQQDYAWCLTALAWTIAALAWWRFGRSQEETWPVPGLAVLAIVTASLHLSVLLIPVELRRGQPHRQSWETLMSIVQAGQIGVWWLAAARGKALPWRVMALAGTGGLLIAAACRHLAPSGLAWVLALTGTFAAACWMVVLRTHGRLVAMLGCELAALWASTHGPLAELVNEPQRFTDVSRFGSVAALAHAAAGFLCMAHLIHLRAESIATPEMVRYLHRARWMLLGWITLGALLAELAGRLGRQTWSEGIVARVRTAAALIDLTVLEQGFGPEFRIDQIISYQQPNGTRSPAGISEFLRSNPFGATAAQLTQIELTNPDLQWAHVVTFRGDYVVGAVYSTRMRSRPGALNLRGAITPQDRDDWARRRSWVEGPIPTHYGPVVQARAALVTPTDKMLGWLAFDLSATRWIASQALARLLASSGVSLGALLLGAVILQRIHQEQRRMAELAAAEARVHSESKTAFLAKVSHELRTPLQSILAGCELIDPSGLSARDRERWQSLRQQTGLMIRLVNDLIDLSALEKGQFSLQPRPVMLADLLRQIVLTLQPRTDGRPLELRADLAPDLPATVLVDAERLRQILVNLIGNALKYTPHGSIQLTARRRPDASIDLLVEDTGPGIDAGDLGRLGTLFFRAAGTAADTEGFGLGLALTFALCERMGGRLFICSDGRHGTAALARLPLPPCATEPPAATSAEITLADARILVVEDNATLRRMFCDVLEAQGGTCVEAATGEIGLRLAEAQMWHVVLLDVGLPDLDGITVARRLRANTSARGTQPILGISAHAGAPERAAALAAGMDEFLVKPFEPVVLLATVARLLARPPRRRTETSHDRSLHSRLVPLFLASAPAEWAQIEAALASAPAGGATLFRAAHHLKSSAIAIDDRPLLDAMSALEKAASSNDLGCIVIAAAEARRCMQRWLQPASHASASIPEDSPQTSLPTL